MEQKKSSERLVFFTDAVVAIALTLLVLPLTDLVPELVAEHKPAVEAVTDNWSKIVSFLLSFVVIGRFWSVHHRIFEHVRSYSTALVRVNFLWLLTIALLPFPTELIGAYRSERFTVLFYLGTLLASSLCHTTMVFLIRRDPAIRGDAEPVTDEVFWNHVLSAVVFALAVVVGFVEPGFGYYVLVLLAFPSLVARLVVARAGK
ncbi:TMEM175 family protein [Amycolatopsis sp. NPDC098790]|uniref:TMEM175 family protein n=1 Tax=Amycolatopsis sp. NPDC098790 TaxID=3363939 RepID=UPI0038177C77